jgi:hypothetical protein
MLLASPAAYNLANYCNSAADHHRHHYCSCGGASAMAKEAELLISRIDTTYIAT